MAMLPMPALSIPLPVVRPPLLPFDATRCPVLQHVALLTCARSAAPFFFALRGLVHPFGACALRIQRLALSMPTCAYPMARTPRRA